MLRVNWRWVVLLLCSVPTLFLPQISLCVECRLGELVAELLQWVGPVKLVFPAPIARNPVCGDFVGGSRIRA